MKKKLLLVISILAVFTLIAISFASAINTTTPVKKKETPLYGIRTRRAIGERFGKIIDYIKTRFLGDRLFFLPFQWLKYYIQGENLNTEYTLCETIMLCNPTYGCTCTKGCTA